MKFNWNIFITIFAPILAIFVGVFIDRYFKEKPYLMTYLGHASVFNTKTPDGKDMKVHTHAVVIQNLGRKPSKNVKIGHNILPPSFSVNPPSEYHINHLPDGTKEIHFPKVTPKERIFINYLYFPPVVWQNINTYIKSDEGPAKRVNMQLTPIYPKIIRLLSVILFLMGLVFSIYLIAQLIEWLIGSFL